jgi:crotonobetainyl-CoA:carnitine CoA-transferase CaiB-like acyl-CoA transferase
MVSGPYCGKLLADMGADVIKIEEPPEGDPARVRGPFPNDDPHPERSGLFLYVNTSKRGITLDLDKPGGLDALKRLLGWADVLIDNHRLERLESLGLTWEALHKENPGLIFTSITPYGHTGPRSRYKGTELTAYHGGGMGSLLPTRSVNVDRPPIKAGGYPTGYHSGLTAALATAAALWGRRANGVGRLIDVSEEEVILALVRTGIAGHIYHHTTWSRVPDRPVGGLECRDGHIVMLVAEEHHWRALIELMGNPEWASGGEWGSMLVRASRFMELTPRLEAWRRQQSKEDIHHRGAAKGLAIGPVYTAEEVMNYRQYKARDYFVEVDHPEAGKFRYAGWPYKMPASPPRVQRPAPLLGQHNEDVLQGLVGYSPDEFADLCRSGAVWKEK